MATVVAASNNNNGGGGGGGGGGSVEQEIALMVQQQKKQQRSSDAADHTKVTFDISREALEKLMLYHQHSFAEAMAGLDEALNIYVEFFWKDLVFPMQSPILFRKLDMKSRIRAALADAARDVAGEIERFTRKWSVQDKPGMSTEDARKLANMVFVESTLGGVVVRYVVRGNKGDTSNEAPEAVLHSLPAAGCSDNEQALTVLGKTIELPPPTSTLLKDDRSDDSFATEPPASTPPSPSGQTDKEATASAPPSTSGQVEQAATAEEFAADALGRNDHDRSGSSKPPPLSSSDEEESMSLPTPPLSSPSASSIDDSPLASLTEPTTLVLLPPAIVDEVVVDGSTDSRNDADSSYGDDSSTTCKPPPLSSSSEEGSPASPTPPLSSPSASSMDEPPQSPDIEPPSFTLPLSTPPTSSPQLVPLPPPSSPSTFSLNPLGGMFSPPLDQPGVTAVITDILCSKRVMNDRHKAVRVLAELESGCICGENMEWVVRGLRTLKAKRELKQRHHGLVFRGPRYGAPLYKTGNGVRRLLRGVAKKHGAGTKFVVCASSSSGIAADNVKMVTGTISAPSAQAPAPASGAARVEPVIDGDVPGLEDWSNIRGNLDDGCRLWAWVY